MKTALLSLLTLISFTVHCQIWQKTIGQANRQEVFCKITETYDKGYLVLGRMNDYPDSKAWVVKTDINGNILYDIIIGSHNLFNQKLVPNNICPTSDGGFIMCGSFNFAGSTDIGVVKIDGCGNLEWCRYFSNPDIAWGVRIYQTTEGGYTMLTHGFESHPYYDKTNTHLFRFDENGNTLWIQPLAERAIHPLIVSNSSKDFILTQDNKYCIVGSCYMEDTLIPGSGILKGLILKADNAGNEKWVNILAGGDYNGYNSITSIMEKNSGNFYMGSSGYNENWVPGLLVADSSGVIIHDSIPAIPQSDGKIAIYNLFYPTFFQENRLFAMSQMADDEWGLNECIAIHEIDTLGGWINSFMMPEATWPYTFIKTFNNRFIVGGTSQDRQDIILFKLTDSLEYDEPFPFILNYDYLCPDPIVSKTIDLSDCEVIVNVEDIPTRKEYNARISLIPITPAPNPAKDFVRFLLENTEHHKNIRVVCYDIFGRQMAEIPVNSGVNETGLSISGWRPGLYMAVVYSGNKQMGKARFVVE